MQKIQSSMRSQILLLYFAVFISIVGFGMVLPLLPFYAESFGATPAQIGFLASSFSLFQFLAAPVIGRVSDRFGRKPVLAISLLGTAFSLAIFGLGSSLAQLFVARSLHGLFSAGSFPIAAAYIGDVTEKKERVRYMGRLAAIFAVGFIVGPAASGFLTRQGASLPFFIASALAFLNFLFILLFLPESLTKKAEKLVIREGFLNIKFMIKNLRGEFGVLFFLLFAWAFGISNLQVAFPLYSSVRFGFGEADVGFVFAMIGAIAAVAQWFILPRITKMVGEHQTIKLATAGMGIGQILLALAPSGFLLNFFMGVSTLGSATLRPTINAILSEETREGQGTTMGLAFSFESFGRVVGPLLAGELIATIGAQSQFVVTSLILIVGLLFLIRSGDVRHKI